MKIILKQDIHGLGKKDDIVNASDGSVSYTHLTLPTIA